jgi:hypothetical protein
LRARPSPSSPSPSHADALLPAAQSQAVPEQQRLTVQLARNSFYFTAAALVIRAFGDQLAI